MLSEDVPRTPLFLSFRKAGKIIGCDHKTAKVWAEREGLIGYFNGRPKISVELLKQNFSDVYWKLLAERGEHGES